MAHGDMSPEELIRQRMEREYAWKNLENAMRQYMSKLTREIERFEAKEIIYKHNNNFGNW